MALEPEGRSLGGTPYTYGVGEDGVVLLGLRMAFLLPGEPGPRLSFRYRIAVATDPRRPEAVVHINERDPAVRVTLPAVQRDEYAQFFPPVHRRHERHDP